MNSDSLPEPSNALSPCCLPSRSWPQHVVMTTTRPRVRLRRQIAIETAKKGSRQSQSQRRHRRTKAVCSTLTAATQRSAGGDDGSADDGAGSFDAEAPAQAPADAPAPAAADELSDGGRSSADSGGLFAEETAPEPPTNPGRDNRFQDYGIRDFIDTDVDATSTFALDVDTGSYSLARQWLNDGVAAAA